MGQGLSQEELQKLKEDSHLDEATLQRLGKSFASIDKDHSGGLSVEEFMAIPELKNNPLVERVARVFDIDKNGNVDFKEFVTMLALFGPACAPETKAKFLFEIYDINGDGFISNGDLFKSLKIMVGNNLEDKQLQQLVDRTISQGDHDKDGKLNYTEFLAMVQKIDIGGKLVLDI